MSRKFRVWDKKNAQFDDSGCIYIDQDGNIFLIEERNLGMNSYMHREEVSERYEITYSTGLKDKNGKEIYEGDIIEHDYADDPQAVVWAEDFFAYRLMPSEIFPIGVDVKTKKMEVIGNIYEHPHLLEGSA